MGLDLTAGGQSPAREEIIGIVAGMEPEEREEALIEAVVGLSERVEAVEAALAATRGALGHLSSS